MDQKPWAMIGHEQRTQHLLKEILHELRSVRRMLEARYHTAKISIRFSGESMPNALVFNVGQTSTASIVPLQSDGATPSGGVVSAVSFTFSDPSATVVLNSDGVTALCTGVAASTGPISGSASCTVTDTDSAVSTWTQAFTIQTNAVTPPSQLTQSVAINFSTSA